MMKVLSVITAGILLRFIGINWDDGFHLHPDERMLLIVADRIHFFDALNPNFFNYGSLPVYLLKAVTQLYGFLMQSNIATYGGMLIPGRILSLTFDLLTLLVLYKISRELFQDKTVAIWSSIFYAIAFFPVQNSHFFIVDTFLTFFITVLFWRILICLKDPCFNTIFYVAIAFSFALATKFTAIIFLPFLIVLFLFHMNKKGQLVVNPLKQSIIQISTFCILSSIFFFLSMPYAFLEFNRFYADILNQVQMNSNPYIFPYTLQYVGTLPYLYHLKQIFLWGMGPVITTLSSIGFIFILNSKFKVQSSKLPSKHQKNNRTSLIIFFTFYIFYFIIIGRSAVKFMRYMLPFYPFLAILAGYGMYRIQNLKFKVQNFNSKFKILNFKLQLLTYFVFILSFLWTLLFVNIYSQKHTRIAATEWILKHIPEGKTLAIEHWDDRLPLAGQEKYKMIELTLYDQPDDERKWNILDGKMNKSDYLIIASNRLYIPLQKLSDCQKYDVCYPKTAAYYRALFEGRTGFEKVAEFSVYPHLRIGSFTLEIPDDTADESFTVYDHPHIFIFKKK